MQCSLTYKFFKIVNMTFFRTFLFGIAVLSTVTLVAQVDYETIQVKSNYSAGWGTNRTKLVSLIPGYTSVSDGSDDFTRSGTYKHLRTDSTGFFYVKKINDRWWLIDPDGYAGINMAVTSFSSSAIQNDYDITKRNGFNGTGNFLASESQTKSGYNLQNYVNFSFTRRLNFFLTYKNERKNYYSTPSSVQGSLDHILVFDPQFETFCDSRAKINVTPFATERDLLGWYTDNEINFNQDQLRNLVKDLLPGDPSRDSALAFAASKGLTEADCINYTTKVTETIKQEFATLLAERYFRIVSEAIRRYDTNHLIIGSRFHGRPRGIQGVVDASHNYMDVTSVNFYDRFTPNEQIARDTWTKDKPTLIGEFYIKDINQQKTAQSGAGWYVNSQAHRGYFYQNTCIELLQNKDYIGWQYFRFKDDDDGSNKGIVSNALVEYVEMTQYMEQLNKQVYRLIDFYDGIDRRPRKSTTISTVTAIEDTHVVPGSANTQNFGTADELEVLHHTVEANRRESFLKFDLSAYASKLKFLKNAQLEISITQSNEEQRYIFASGISETNWEENSLTGAIRQTSDDWRQGYNRMDFKKGVISTGKQLFDVTNWIADQPLNTTVSFKIHDITSSNTILKIASSEHSDQSMHPKLILTFWDESTAVPAVNNNSKVRVYPNPASDLLHFKAENLQSVDIYSLKGERLMTTTGESLNVSQLAGGLYIVKVEFAEGEVSYHKVTIQS